MAPEVLAAHSGVDLFRVVGILFNSQVPEIDEAFMMFTALEIPLGDLVEHAKCPPFLPPPKEYFCGKCRMTFPVREKWGAESTMCSVPDCRVRFWHGSTTRIVDGIQKGIATIGVTPEDAVSLRATRGVVA